MDDYNLAVHKEYKPCPKKRVHFNQDAPSDLQTTAPTQQPLPTLEEPAVPNNAHPDVSVTPLNNTKNQNTPAQPDAVLTNLFLLTVSQLPKTWTMMSP